MKTFTQWLIEWEGFNFQQEKDLVNGPQYPNSKYKGKGDPDEQSGEIDQPTKKAIKAFGFTPDDKLLKLTKKMRTK